MVHSQEFYSLYQSTFLKYTELYGQQVCIFLLKGSFYELYGIYDPVKDVYENTVKEVADLLDLQLKVYPNDVKNEKTGLFGGVPEHSIHKWAGKLCSQGWTCVLIDQVKDASNNVIERKVARVLSPGTHIEQAPSDESMYVCSIYLHTQSLINPPNIGIAAVECASGDVIHFSAYGTGSLNSWHADTASQLTAMLQPKEVIITWNGPGLFCPDESQLRILFEIPSTIPIHLTVEQEEVFANDFIREEYLSSHFQHESLLNIRVWASLLDSPYAEQSLVRLLRYLEDHDINLIKRLNCPQAWNPSEKLQVLNHAMEQLNIKQPFGVCVEKLLNKCITSIGKRTFKMQLNTPYCIQEPIIKRHSSIEWVLKKDKVLRRSLECCLRAMFDVSRMNRSISRGVLSHSGAQQLYQTYEAITLFLEQVHEPDSPFYNETIHSAIVKTKAVLESLTKKTVVMMYTSDSDSHINWLSTSYSPNTHAIENTLNEYKAQAQTILSEFESFASLTKGSLAFKPTDTSKYAFTITKTTLKNIQSKSNQPPSSLKGVTYKIQTGNVKVECPALDSLHDKTILAEEAFRKAFQKELMNVCVLYVKETYNYWKIIEDWIAETDILVTHANVAEHFRLCKPIITFSEESKLSIENLRHIIIESQKTQVKYTTHNVSLDNETSGILLYGINASGKSSLMKAIGIAVVLAQCGLYVPATSMTLTPFQILATRILNHDNILQGMSSFTVEMSELREILRVSNNRTLVLGDEVCAGTENVSGTAIVAASLQHLLKNSTRFIFATHLHDLLKCTSVIQNPYLRIFHLKVEYDSKNDTLIYHRTLSPGAGTTYYGLEVAKALHIPSSVLESAYEFRRHLMNEADITSVKGSIWNSDKVKVACEVCNCQLKSVLEVHHIQERANAENNTNKDGSGLHDLRNLVTVCESCHDKHHAKIIEIKEVLQTSKGPKRDIIKKESKINTQMEKQPKFSQEQITIIREFVKENPGLKTSFLLTKLQHTIGIELKSSELKKLLN